MISGYGIDAIDAARENQKCGTDICFLRRKEVADERVDILRRRVGAKSGNEPDGILLSKARFKSRFSYLKIEIPTLERGSGGKVPREDWRFSVGHGARPHRKGERWDCHGSKVERLGVNISLRCQLTGRHRIAA
jgi:hypothetical protein